MTNLQRRMTNALRLLRFGTGTRRIVDLIARAPSDIPTKATLLPFGGGNWQHLAEILSIVRPDVSVAQTAPPRTAFLLLCSHDWRSDLAKARAQGHHRRSIVFPLGGSYHEFFSVPLHLIYHKSGRLEMSLNALKAFVGEMGPFFGEYRDGEYVPDMIRYAPSQRVVKTNLDQRKREVLSILADNESREDFCAAFSAEPFDLWRHWARDLYNGLQYTDYIKIFPGDIILNCGIHGGSELPFYLANLDGSGCLINIDPLGHNYLTTDVREAIDLAPATVIEVPAALHDVDGSIDLPVVSGGMAAGNLIGVQIDNAPLRKFKAISLDSLSSQLSLTRLDHVKMDIEGAEERALLGGIETLKRFRPNLAISIYHTPDQFLDIPIFLSKQLPRYRFFIRNYHFISNETILYGVPHERSYKKRQRSIQVFLNTRH